MTAAGAIRQVESTSVPAIEARIWTGWPIAIFWIAGAVLVVGFALALTLGSDRFSYEWDVVEMPVLALAGGLVLAGAIYFAGMLALPRCFSASRQPRFELVTAIIIGTGLTARLILFASEPMLEDDYQRYLWDGAVTAHGINPYTTPPREVLRESRYGDGELAKLARRSGNVIKRVNHNELTTIYPPVAQAAFAIAHTLVPFSLTAWRTVLLACDAATLVLLLSLLNVLGRSSHWLAVYWWNPVVLKELFNSAHMDAIVLPLVLLTLLLVAKARPVAAAGALAFAAGAKIWPVLLAPVVLRAAGSRRQFAQAAVLFAGLCLLLAVPFLYAGLDNDAGLVAYAQSWTINSPLYASLDHLVRDLFAAAHFATPDAASLLTRTCIATAVAIVAVAAAWQPIRGPSDLIARALLVTVTLVFLSPAIYPWYTVWIIPLLALRPNRGLLFLTVTIPLYYLYFYFAARGNTALFHDYIVWIIWLPVWLLCLADSRFWQQRRGKNNAPYPSHSGTHKS